jgi:hypothetical protein
LRLVPIVRRIGLAPIEAALLGITLVIFCVAIFTSRFLPFTDYPGHLSIAGILHRSALGDPATVATYSTNLLSYNSLFHAVAFALSFVMPLERAGEAAVCLYFVALPLVTIALLRALEKPAHRALAVPCFLVGFPVTWGFFNWCFGVVLGLLVVARLLKAEKLSPRALAVTAILAWLTAYAHLFAFVCTVFLAGSALLARALAEPRAFVARASRALVAMLATAPATIYCAIVYARQQRGAIVFDEYTRFDGEDVPAWTKVFRFVGQVLTTRVDAIDAKIFEIALVVLLLAIPFRVASAGRRASAGAIGLFVAALALYLLLPSWLWSTARVYERTSVLLLVAGLVALPKASAWLEPVQRALVPVLGLAAALSFLDLRLAQRTTFADLDRVLDAAPKQRGVMVLLDSTAMPNWNGNAIGHVGSYYLARNGGESAVSFLRYMSLPAQYRPARLPPRAPDDLAWDGAVLYDKGTDYARYFDLVLHRASPGHENDDPRARVWGADDAARIAIVAHSGEWWLFDAKQWAAERRVASDAPR